MQNSFLIRSTVIFSAVAVMLSLFFISKAMPYENKAHTRAEISLSGAERAWLADRPVLRMGVWINVPPYAFLDPAGQPQGIFLDYLAAVEKKIGMQFQIVALPSFAAAWGMAMRKELDMLVAVTPSRRHTSQMRLTRTYHEVPVVLATRSDYRPVEALADFKGKTVVVNRGHVTEQWIKRDFPGVATKRTEDYETGLRWVSEGKADAYVGAMAALTWQITKHRITNLKIAAKTPYAYRLSIAVRKDWPEAVDILNRALTALEKSGKNDIYDKWITLRFEHGIDWVYLLKVIGGIVAVSVLICLIIWRWNRLLQGEIERREKTEIELRESERQLSTLMGNLPGMAYRCLNDGKWTMLYLSDGCRSLTGYLASDFVENRRIGYNDLVVTQDRQAVRSEVEKAVGENRPFMLEYRITDKNRQEKWVWEKGVALPERQNGVVILEGFISDISERKNAELTRERLIEKLGDALAQVRTLSGLLPICSICKKIRDDRGYWNRIESYIETHSEAQFSHGICKECIDTYYPGLDLDDEEKETGHCRKKDRQERSEKE